MSLQKTFDYILVFFLLISLISFIFPLFSRQNQPVFSIYFNNTQLTSLNGSYPVEISYFTQNEYPNSEYFTNLVYLNNKLIENQSIIQQNNSINKYTLFLTLNNSQSNKLQIYSIMNGTSYSIYYFLK